jgi:hypothetical protein
MSNQWPSILIAVALTIVSGIGDSYGFIHAAEIWRDGALVPGELGRSVLGFAFGVGVYFVVVRYLNQLGVTSPELQTLGWFGVTIVGVSLVNGDVARWALVDRAVAMVCVAGICWLMVHAKA